MSFEPVTPSQAEQHKNWKAARARLLAPETLRPKLVVSNPVIAVHVPTEEETRQELMDFTIAAVANVSGLVPKDILEGVPTVEVCNARKLAIGLCATRHQIDKVHIAGYFGVHQRAVTNAAKALDLIIIEYSISTRTPLELVLPTIWPRWLSTLQATSILDIQAAVCEKWGISRVDLLSQRRAVGVVVPRQAAMAICKQITTSSYPEIARMFGGRDHVTVMHAIRKFESRMAQIDLPPFSPVLAWVSALHAILQANPFKYGSAGKL